MLSGVDVSRNYRLPLTFCGASIWLVLYETWSVILERLGDGFIRFLVMSTVK